MWVMYLQRTTHKKHENYNLDKPKNSLLNLQRWWEALLALFFFHLTSFEAEAKQTWGQQIPISAKHQRVHSVWVSF